MATRLKDLTVEFVSLVDRAAVRNAENPDEPQRFLLAKSDVPVWGREAVKKEETPSWDDLRQRISALEKRTTKRNGDGMSVTKEDSRERVTVAAVNAALRAPDGDPRVADLVKLLDELATPVESMEGQERAPLAPRVGPADEGNDDPIAKSMADLRELAKSADARGRQQIRKASEALQLEYLHRVSPAGAAAWESRFSGPAAPTSERAQLLQKAEALQKRGLSRFEAMRQAGRENPELVGRVEGYR
jgi:hypothetical protein